MTDTTIGGLGIPLDKEGIEKMFDSADAARRFAEETGGTINDEREEFHNLLGAMLDLKDLSLTDDAIEKLTVEDAVMISDAEDSIHSIADNTRKLSDYGKMVLRQLLGIDVGQ
jgi:methyl-accepting chemotaxis protein